MTWQMMDRIALSIVGLGFSIVFVGIVCGFIAVGMRYYQEFPFR